MYRVRNHTTFCLELEIDSSEFDGGASELSELHFEAATEQVLEF